MIAKLEGKKLKRQSQRAIEKEEITNTEFPEGGNTTSTKDPPGISTGRCTQCVNENVMGKAISSDNPVIYCWHGDFTQSCVHVLVALRNSSYTFPSVYKKLVTRGHYIQVPDC